MLVVHAVVVVDGVVAVSGGGSGWCCSVELWKCSNLGLLAIDRSDKQLISKPCTRGCEVDRSHKGSSVGSNVGHRASRGEEQAKVFVVVAQLVTELHAEPRALHLQVLAKKGVPGGGGRDGEWREGGGS